MPFASWLFPILFTLAGISVQLHRDPPALWLRLRHDAGVTFNVLRRGISSDSNDWWYSQIDSVMWLGELPVVERNDHLALKALNVTHIIALVEDFERQPGLFYTPVSDALFASLNITVSQYRVADHAPLEPPAVLQHMVSDLLHIVSWRQPQQQRVYVHCRSGIGRSASLIQAYLMYAYGMRVNEALQYMQTHRPRASPNKYQSAALEAYEASIIHIYGEEQ